MQSVNPDKFYSLEEVREEYKDNEDDPVFPEKLLPIGYIPTDASKACSANCSAELHRRNSERFEKTHRDSRNQRQRERYAKRKADRKDKND